MQKRLPWIQFVLLLLLMQAGRVEAAQKREQKSREGKPFLHFLRDHSLPHFPHPGDKPQFSKKFKNRQAEEHPESNQAEADYLYKRFDPNCPPPTNRTLSITFQRITTQARGRLYEIIPVELPQTLETLVEEKAQPQTDLVFVIDQTGSMQDDVASVEREIGKTLEKYADTPQLRVGAATYSGVKTDGASGFSLHELQHDASYLPAFMANIQFMGGIEDLFGGVIKTVTLINWQRGSKRVMVVLTDEPPETDPRWTDYTEQEMLQMVQRAKVELNVILVG